MKSPFRPESVFRSATQSPSTALLLKLLTSALFAFAWVAAGADWAERFAVPPANARILKIIHNWPDYWPAQSAAPDQLIGRFRTQGFGGVVCNVSFQQYLESDAHWLAFTRAVNEAKQAGLALWLYDERGYLGTEGEKVRFSVALPQVAFVGGKQP